MDKFAIYSAIHNIESCLRDEPELLSQERDTVAALLKDMEMLQNLLGEAAHTPPEEATEIRGIASDAEDVIDMFVYNIRSVDQHEGLAKIGGSIFNIQRADSFGFKLEAVRKRIQDLMERLEVHRGMANDFKHPSSGGSIPCFDWGGPVNRDDKYVVGLEGDVLHMVHQLTANQGDESQPYLFLITGFPGAGKTTLLRTLYKNTTLRQHFHRLIWYRPEHGLGLLSWEIFKMGPEKYHNETDAKTWLDDIGKCVFFLDDTTYSMTETVEYLLQAFPTGLKGSMFIITGSNEEDYLQFKEDSRCHFHEMRGYVNEEQGWDLLCHLTCPKQKLRLGENTLLEMLGKEMLQKLEGKPEAITLLGGILRFKSYSIEEWEMVKKALIRCINGHGVKGVYELCYLDLPYYMKACFLYMAIFPAKHQIQAGVFRRMWIAERCEPKYSEDTVMQCLEELFQRHLIQVMDRNHMGSIKVFQLQGAVYEFCITKARKENFINIQPSNLGTSMNSRITAFHSRRCIRRRDSFLRSIFHIERLEDVGMTIDIEYKHLTLLRVLTLWGVRISSNCLPGEIGSLLHLRYLALRNTNIEVLPESIGNLKKLLTLDWRDVDVHKSFGAEIDVPDVIWKMEQLRHLYIPQGMSVKDRFKLHTLTNLHTLWGLRVGPWLVHDIKKWNFPNMQRLCLRDIMGHGELKTVVRNLSKMPNLCELRLLWFSPFQILTNMEPFHNYCGQLSQLKLCGPIGENVALRFPNNLRVLILERSAIMQQDPMIVIGECCPKLKVLKLKWDAYTGTEMRCKAGSFAELEELVVEDMENLENWIIEKGALLHLKRLCIIECHKLKRMPEDIRFINTLQELKLEKMARNFCDKLVKVEEHNYFTLVGNKIKGEDFYIIQHIPDISFLNIESPNDEHNSDEEVDW